MPGAADIPDPAAPSVTPAALARVADQRTRLQLVATALAQDLEPRAVAAQVLAAAAGVLGASAGWVAMVSADGTHAELLDALGFSEEVLAPWARVPLDTDVPMTVAIRSGVPSYHASAADRRMEFPAVVVPGVPSAGIQGSAVVPLVFEGRTTGSLGVSFREPRTLDTDERWFLEALAAQGSAALERARLFAELREQDERLHFALEASGTGTWEWRLGDDLMIWSPLTHALHGLPPDVTPAGLDAWLRLVHPDDRERVVAAIERVIASGGQYEVELRLVHPDGSVHWLASSGRLFPAAGDRPARMMGTSRDITDRKLAEAERDRMIEAEREAARLRDAFTGVVSHELRTPITTIYGGTRFLARRWRELEEPARDEVLGDVVEEADRLYRLVEDLMVLTNVERGTLDVGDEPIHPGRIVERVVASERGRWPGVEFAVQVAPGLPSAAGEDAYLEQILRNLLGNAVKYGGAGSTVTVRAFVDNAWVCVEVADQGPGLAGADPDQLFNLFYRAPATAGTVPGAGIGLFVCQQLAHAMGGRILAGNGPDGGAVFCACLPAYADDDTDDPNDDPGRGEPAVSPAPPVPLGAAGTQGSATVPRGIHATTVSQHGVTGPLR